MAAWKTKQSKANEAIAVFEASKAAAEVSAEKFLKEAARGRLWCKIVASLSDFYQSAVGQVVYGDAGKLLEEIDAFMTKDQHGHKARLIVEFWAATFEVEGCNDLTKWIHYVNSTVRRLVALEETISETSKVAMFTSALPKDIFGQFKIALFGKTPTWEELLVSVRAYANVAEIQEQLKNLSSAHAKTAHHRPAGVFNINGQESKTQGKTDLEACRNFLKGTCTRAASCRYSHAMGKGGATPAAAAECVHCNGRHNSAACWQKFPLLKPQRRPRGAARDPAAVLALVTELLHSSPEASTADVLALLSSPGQPEDSEQVVDFARLLTFSAEEGPPPPTMSTQQQREARRVQWSPPPARSMNQSPLGLPALDGVALFGGMSPVVSDSDTPDLVDTTGSSGADSDTDGLPDLLDSTDSSSSSDAGYPDLLSGSDSEESSWTSDSDDDSDDDLQQADADMEHPSDKGST